MKVIDLIRVTVGKNNLRHASFSLDQKSFKTLCRLRTVALISLSVSSSGYREDLLLVSGAEGGCWKGRGDKLVRTCKKETGVNYCLKQLCHLIPILVS